ncbi:MAG: hypothetical protein IJJ69_10220 [Oscillospiraceae bacterium]|nr:hypothetical protein [Oscillospiraceae bacterium]
MKKRQLKFILALTFLSVIIWIIGEFIIGELFNSFALSVIWAVICLILCCAYSLWKCPREPDEDDDEHLKNQQKEDK